MDAQKLADALIQKLTSGNTITEEEVPFSYRIIITGSFGTARVIGRSSVSLEVNDVFYLEQQPDGQRVTEVTGNTVSAVHLGNLREEIPGARYRESHRPRAWYLIDIAERSNN